MVGGRHARLRLRPRPCRALTSVPPGRRAAAKPSLRRHRRVGRASELGPRRPAPARPRCRPRRRPGGHPGGHEDPGAGRRGRRSEGQAAGSRRGAASTRSTPRPARPRRWGPRASTSSRSTGTASGPSRSARTSRPRAPGTAPTSRCSTSTRAPPSASTSPSGRSSARVLAGDRVWFVEGFCSDRGVLAGERQDGRARRRDYGRSRRELDISLLAFGGTRITSGYAGLRGMGRVFGTRSSGEARRRDLGGDPLVGARFQACVSAGGDDALTSPSSSPPTGSSGNVLFDDGDGAPSDLAQRRGMPDPKRVAGLGGVHLGIRRRHRDRRPALVPKRAEAARCRSSYRPRRANLVLDWCFFRPAPGCRTCSHPDGYAVLLPNPRGSAGRGQEFAARPRRHGRRRPPGHPLRRSTRSWRGRRRPDRIAFTAGATAGSCRWRSRRPTVSAPRSRCSPSVTDWRSFHGATNIGASTASSSSTPTR